MELVVIIGPPAVGKMSVGRALCKYTGFRLFHNHMSLEPILGVFDWETPQFKRLVKEFRMRIFEEASTSNIPGLVFTYVWAFGEPGEKEGIDELCAIFEKQGVVPRFVELTSNLETRLQRNRHPDRLAEKASKRNVEKSEQMLLKHEAQYTFNSNGDFCYPERHLLVDNTHLSPDETAMRVVKHFGFQLNG